MVMNAVIMLLFLGVCLCDAGWEGQTCEKGKGQASAAVAL